MLFISAVTGLMFAFNFSTPEDGVEDSFDLVQLSTNYVEPKEKKYQAFLSKKKYEKLMNYYEKQKGEYSSTDRDRIYKEYYTPARIAYASTINTLESWDECLTEIPKSEVYTQYRFKYESIEDLEHGRTIATKTFNEWSWFLAVYEGSKDIAKYYDEYEQFHFDEVKDSGDIEQLVCFWKSILRVDSMTLHFRFTMSC